MEKKISKEKWKKSYYTTTYKVRMYLKHEEYLKLTQDIYNDLIKKYFDVLYEKQELLEMSSFNCLAELERLTIIPKTGPRKGEIPKLYFEQNAPTYLRRAAINQAMGLVKLHISTEKRAEESNHKIPKIPKKFNSSTVFYKGMYKDFEGNSIKLKLFDGTEWRWFKAKLPNLTVPKNADILSPTIVMHEKYILAHIPIKKPIEDIIPIRYRMEEKDLKICSVMFTNTDKFAICIILDKKGNFIKSKFISGGNKYSERTSRIFKQIQKSNKKKHNYCGNKKLWNKLHNTKEYYAHKVSREITNFCIENHVRVLSYADYKNGDLTEKQYKKRIGQFGPLGLREKIIKYLTYKTFKEGINTDIRM